MCREAALLALREDLNATTVVRTLRATTERSPTLRPCDTSLRC